jgi:hypothetical protein
MRRFVRFLVMSIGLLALCGCGTVKDADGDDDVCTWDESDWDECRWAP